MVALREAGPSYTVTPWNKAALKPDLLRSGFFSRHITFENRPSLMDNIFDVYTFIRQLADKAGIGFLDADQVSGWLGASQMSMVNMFRANGLLDNVTQTALSPFVESTPFSAITGLFTKPTDFMQVLRIESQSSKEYTPVLFNELRDALASQLEPIARYPRYMEQGNSIQLYPQDRVSGTMFYYRLPVSPIIGVLPNGDGSDVEYDPTTSVELELPKEFWFQVIINALPYAGVNLSSADLLALTKMNAE